ncbi:TRAP transporter, 4TM/12TM fusion protein [Dethiosulfovibrio peptidovorans DSM 11002]|uniref:TRAP transporter, 4TM/12TM fusion protein n=1 Tax=Dethiosulfovibrio peptidovorans DSM 11002 TaxID=469381 RepID=D2Z5B8_9BACT|nr:TRAP transporter permease [Dethiosulfovibrio peptidovorans]EFC90665.1 TRAP transporter, 4TM/12TM fusion protein [Dethiosulfovibrio peptidovorans DSM 11002]
MSEEILKNPLPVEEPDSKKRTLTGWQYTLVAGLALAASSFHLYTAAFGLFAAMYQRSVHWLFMGVILFLIYPASKNRPKDRIDPLDWVLAILLSIGCLNILLNWQEIAIRQGAPIASDVYLGVIMVVLVIEGTRRAMGWPLPIMAIISLLYAFFGPYFPGILAHGGIPIGELAPFQYLRTDGIFGVPLGVSASFIFLFVLFGAFLSTSGAGQFFIDLAVALTGRSQGGPGKAAVVSSALMGTVSGSSCANTVTTGAFTIPLMKQSGYSSEFAGAIVAAASTGGQVMPPVMGAAAFIMAQFLGISYWEIVVAAAIPATLYFVSIMAMVHFRAGKIGMKRLSGEDLPKAGKVLKEGWHLLIPIITLIAFLATGYSPVKAVFWSIVFLIGCSWLGKKEHRMTPGRILQAMIDGAIGAVDVAAACACSGIVIGVIGITGVGLAFSSFVLSLSHGILPFALMLTMVGSIILGMGVPTTAQYIITSTLAAPALAEMGVPMMAAHLFCLYFGVLADVTPPVALATYAASGIAKSNPMKTGFTALIVAVAGFLVPYMFVYNHYLLFQGNIFQIAIGCGSAFLCIIGLASGVQGYFLTHINIVERAALLATPFLIIAPYMTANLIAVGLMVAVFMFQKLKLSRAAQLSSNG